MSSAPPPRLIVLADTPAGPVHAPLEHGQAPTAALAQALAAAGVDDMAPGAWTGMEAQGDVIRLQFGVVPRSQGHPGATDHTGVDGHTSEGEGRGLVTVHDEEPVQRQRVAAYAVVESAGRWLLTEFSDTVAGEGRWGLPGGGLEPGEHPLECVVREVWEETGQLVEPTDLLTVQSAHWVGSSPSGVLEDFHAVRLIVRAACAEPGEPVVHDIGGTTASARWVPVDDALALALTPGTRAVLEQLLQA